MFLWDPRNGAGLWRPTRRGEVLVLDSGLPAEPRCGCGRAGQGRVQVVPFGRHVDGASLAWACVQGLAATVTMGRLDTCLAAADWGALGSRKP